MRLWLLQLLVYWQSVKKMPPSPEVRLTRFCLLVATALCLEVAIWVWIAGAVRPLSPTWPEIWPDW